MIMIQNTFSDGILILLKSLQRTIGYVYDPMYIPNQHQLRNSVRVFQCNNVKTIFFFLLHAVYKSELARSDRYIEKLL